jgi:hypothetical protein
MGCNEADAVRSARPEGKKCRLNVEEKMVELFVMLL